MFHNLNFLQNNEIPDITLGKAMNAHFFLQSTMQFFHQNQSSQLRFPIIYLLIQRSFAIFVIQKYNGINESK